MEAGEKPPTLQFGITTSRVDEVEISDSALENSNV